MRTALVPHDSVSVASRSLAVRQWWTSGRGRRRARQAGGPGVVSATRLPRRSHRDGQARLV
jgi:hypothetical protein